MTLKEFRTLAYSFHGNPQEFWTENGVDLLLLYMNSAITQAVGAYSFNSFDKRLLGTVGADGCSLKTGFATADTTPVTYAVKVIKMVYQYSLSGTSIVFGIPYRYKPRSEADRIREFNGDSHFGTFYQEGGYLKSERVGVPVTVAVLACTFPEPITNATTDHFFLDYGSNWLLYQCLEKMNMKVKETERTLISEKMKLNAWRDLLEFDDSQGDSYSNFTDLK